MSNLKKYINKIKEYIDHHEDISETEIIRYVYLDLGKKLSFNEEFLPFGNSRKKQNLYNYRSRNITDLEECMESKKAICKSISYILEYILKDIGIDIKTVVDPNDARNCPHTYNLITKKDGKEYVVDLQEDIYNIHERLEKMKNSYKILKVATDKYISNLKSLEDKLIKESLGILLPFDFDFGFESGAYENIETYNGNIQFVNYEKIDEICTKIDEKTHLLEEKIKTLLDSKNCDEEKINYYNNMNQIVTSLNDFTRFARYVKDEYKKVENSYIDNISSLKE